MAATNKLNATTVRTAPIRKNEYKLSDGGGLYLRVRPSGAKSWLFSFRLPGSRTPIPMTIGSVDDISLKEARQKLLEFRQLVAEGIDPRCARAAAKTENAEAITMQKLFESWIEFLKTTNEVTSIWIKRHQDRWRLHLKIPLGNLLARDVVRGHLAVALDAMTRKGVKEETRKALTTLNLLLDYGLTRHYIDTNHARTLKPKDFAASANRPRSRALSLEELKKLWLSLDQAMIAPNGVAKTSAMSPVTTTAIKLLILTGARRGEVAALEWDDLDMEAGVWTMPSTKTKNRQEHTVYLGSLGKKLLTEIKLLTGQSKYVFCCKSNFDEHIHTDTLTSGIGRLIKSAQKENKKEKSLLAGMKSFTAHDLRRSAATAWGEHLKINPHIIERMLNHQPANKLVATYQRATYVEEQKTAWLAWDTKVIREVTREVNNILPFDNAVNG
jgi:integrase